jgi:hypothetical protein
MITKYYNTRIIITVVILALLITSCTPDVQATRQAILGQAEAITLLAGQSVEEAAPALYAINAVVSGASKDISYMVFNESQQIALFVSKGPAAPVGGYYTYIATVDTAHGGLVNTLQYFKALGIRLGDIKTFSEFKAILRARGFTELTIGALPFLAQTVRLGLGFIKSCGGAVTDFLVVPAGLITTDELYPWCQDMDCGGRKQ